MADNPFTDLRPETHAVIEALLSAVYGDQEWDENHEATLDMWRVARGEDAMDETWQWWVGEVGCFEYDEFAATREAAIEKGRSMYAEYNRFQIIEARLWDDLVKDGEEICRFAQSRNMEVIEVAHG